MHTYSRHLVVVGELLIQKCKLRHCAWKGFCRRDTLAQKHLIELLRMHRTCKNTSVKPDRKWWMTGMRNNEEFLLRTCWKQLFHLTKSAVIQVAKTVQALKILHLSRWFTHTLTQKLLHTNGFTHKDLDRYFAHKSFFHTEALHTDRATNDVFTAYAQGPSHSATSAILEEKRCFTHRRVYTDVFPQTLLHTDAFRHRRLYTHTLYIQKRLHKRFYTQTFHIYRQFYTVTFLHTDTGDLVVVLCPSQDRRQLAADPG